MTTSKYFPTIESNLPRRDPCALISYHYNWKKINRKQYDTILHVRLLFLTFRIRRKSSIRQSRKSPCTYRRNLLHKVVYLNSSSRISFLKSLSLRINISDKSSDKRILDIAKTIFKQFFPVALYVIREIILLYKKNVYNSIKKNFLPILRTFFQSQLKGPFSFPFVSNFCLKHFCLKLKDFEIFYWMD